MMKIAPTGNTPLIEFDAEAGVLRIEGKSIAEDAQAFYKPLIEELGEYIKNPQLQTTVHLKLVYFNTSSSKSILDVLRKLEVLKTRSEVIIKWYYEKEDEDMLEVGEDYREIVNLPFAMIEEDHF
ncbi:MAG: DUF1987 domain-containing protein [Bacteroidia bacterium]